MSSELVSVVMATYNGEKYLRQQMSSILEQTHPNFELIVVDDASADKTLSILKEFAALDNRIHVVTAEKNMGLVANFERGLKLAKGNFIALSDQDDIFRKDKIERLLTELKNQPDRDLVVSDLSLIDENGIEVAQSMWRDQKLKPKQGKPFRRLLYRNFATGCAMMFRRRLLDIAIPFPPDCLVHDWWLSVVATSEKGGGICLVNEHLTAYRQHSLNVIGAKTTFALKPNLIVARIKAPPLGISIWMNEIKLHIARLAGYLKIETWTAHERLMIKKTKETLEGYLSDAHSDIFSRVIKLPQRVRCAATTRSISHCIGTVFVTLWPYK
ncbi:MAG: glycosyltransferase family 2 protein [Gallionella sp.]